MERWRTPRSSWEALAPIPSKRRSQQKAIVGKKLTEETIHAAAEAAYSPAKPLDTSDFAMIWRKDMARYYVAGTLRELAGLPQGLPHPETENSVPVLRVFSSGPFS